MSAIDVAQATGGRITQGDGSAAIGRVSIDSRSIHAGDLFVDRIDPDDPDELCDQTLFARLRLKPRARAKVEHDTFASCETFATRRHEITSSQKHRDRGIAVLIVLLLAFSTPFRRFALVLLFLAIRFEKLLLHALVFLRCAFG